MIRRLNRTENEETGDEPAWKEKNNLPSKRKSSPRARSSPTAEFHRFFWLTRFCRSMSFFTAAITLTCRYTYKFLLLCFEVRQHTSNSHTYHRTTENKWERKKKVARKDDDVYVINHSNSLRESHCGWNMFGKKFHSHFHFIRHDLSSTWICECVCDALRFRIVRESAMGPSADDLLSMSCDVNIPRATIRLDRCAVDTRDQTMNKWIMTLGFVINSLIEYMLELRLRLAPRTHKYLLT